MNLNVASTAKSNKKQTNKKKRLKLGISVTGMIIKILILVFYTTVYMKSIISVAQASSTVTIVYSPRPKMQLRVAESPTLC